MDVFNNMMVHRKERDREREKDIKRQRERERERERERKREREREKERDKVPQVLDSRTHTERRLPGVPVQCLADQGVFVFVIMHWCFPTSVLLCFPRTLSAS